MLGDQQIVHQSLDKTIGGGRARLYSKASVEKNWKRVKGRIESRGVELICPVGGKPGARVKVAGLPSARVAA